MRKWQRNVLIIIAVVVAFIVAAALIKGFNSVSDGNKNDSPKVENKNSSSTSKKQSEKKTDSENVKSTSSSETSPSSSQDKQTSAESASSQAKADSKTGVDKSEYASDNKKVSGSTVSEGKHQFTKEELNDDRQQLDQAGLQGGSYSYTDLSALASRAADNHVSIVRQAQNEKK